MNRAEIARQLARALGLTLVTSDEPHPFNVPPHYIAVDKDHRQSETSAHLCGKCGTIFSLEADGSNLDDPHWFQRAALYLSERGVLTFDRNNPESGRKRGTLIFFPYGQTLAADALISHAAAEIEPQALLAAYYRQLNPEDT